MVSNGTRNVNKRMCIIIENYKLPCAIYLHTSNNCLKIKNCLVGVNGCFSVCGGIICVCWVKNVMITAMHHDYLINFRHNCQVHDQLSRISKIILKSKSFREQNIAYL